MKNAYKSLEIKPQITFVNVWKYISDYPDDFDFNVSGCNNAIWETVGHDKKLVRFILEMDKSDPVYEIVIGFKELEITRTLSEKAIEFKNAHLETRFERIEWFEKNNLPVPEWVWKYPTPGLKHPN